MKKLIIFILLLALCAGGYLATAYFSGGTLPTFGIPLGGEKSQMRQSVLKFWEDIKFKDLNSAASFLPADQRDAANIQGFLQRIFGSAAVTLDIVGYEIETLELDSTGLRARVKTKVMANNLQIGQKINRSVMLFFHKISPGSKNWSLELANSF